MSVSATTETDSSTNTSMAQSQPYPSVEIQSTSVERNENIGIQCNSKQIVSSRPRKRTRNGASKSKDLIQFSEADMELICNTLESIADALKKRATQFRGDLPGCSIAEVLPLVEKLPGIIRGDGLYNFATKLFLRHECREMFVALSEPTACLEWLKLMEKSEYPSYDRPGCSIAEVMPLVEELPGVIRGDDLYMLTTKLFLQRQWREMFVALSEPTIRWAWLKCMERSPHLYRCSHC